MATITSTIAPSVSTAGWQNLPKLGPAAPGRPRAGPQFPPGNFPGNFPGNHFPGNSSGTFDSRNHFFADAIFPAPRRNPGVSSC